MGDGWLRLSAFRNLAQRRKSYSSIPVVVRELNDRQMADLVLEANTVRQDLSPIDLARFYRKYLAEFGITQAELARLHHCSQSEVANTLRLLDLPEELQAKIISHEISETHGRTLLQVNSQPKLQEKLVKQLEEGNLPVSRLDYEVKKALWEKTLPLYVDGIYGNDAPAFDMASCEKCEHRQLLANPWQKEDERKPRCDDRQCWNALQKGAKEAKLKAQLAELAEEAITQYFTMTELSYGKFEMLSGAIRAECKSCPKRGAREADYGDKYLIVCLDPKCFKAKAQEESARQEAERQRQMESAEREVDEVFAQLRQGYDGQAAHADVDLLLALIECLLRAAEDNWWRDSLYKKMAGLFGDGTKSPTVKSLIATFKGLDQGMLYYRVLPRLAFETWRIQNHNRHYEKVLGLFRGQVTPHYEPSASSGGEAIPIDSHAVRQSSRLGMDNEDPLATLEIKTPVDQGEQWKISLGNKHAGASTLEVAILKLFVSLQLIQGDNENPLKNQLIDLLKTYPASQNRKLLLAILEEDALAFAQSVLPKKRSLPSVALAQEGEA